MYSLNSFASSYQQLYIYTITYCLQIRAKYLLFPAYVYVQNMYVPYFATFCFKKLERNLTYIKHSFAFRLFAKETLYSFLQLIHFYRRVNIVVILRHSFFNLKRKRKIYDEFSIHPG